MEKKHFRIFTDELSHKIVAKYHMWQAGNIDVDIVPKTKKGALDMLDTLYDLRVSSAIQRKELGDEFYGDACSILTMIETDIRDWLEKSIS